MNMEGHMHERGGVYELNSQDILLVQYNLWSQWLKVLNQQMARLPQ